MADRTVNGLIWDVEFNSAAVALPMVHSSLLNRLERWLERPTTGATEAQRLPAVDERQAALFEQFPDEAKVMNGDRQGPRFPPALYPVCKAGLKRRGLQTVLIAWVAV